MRQRPAVEPPRRCPTGDQRLSRKEARRQAERFLNRLRRRAAYQCPRCHAWHVGYFGGRS